MTKKIMLTESDIKGTIEFSNASTIKNMAKLLSKHTPITYFAHVRTYSEGYLSALISNPDILVDFAVDSVYQNSRYIQLPGVIQDSYNLWEVDKPFLSSSEKSSAERMLSHDIANGLTIVKNQNNYCDFYTFATTPDK